MPQTTPDPSELTARFAASRTASRSLRSATTDLKNRALLAIADAVRSSVDRVVPANELDLERGRADGMSAGLQDRLRLDEARLGSLADAVVAVAGLIDPVGQTVRGSNLPNGASLSQVRVPFGVVGAIYEARPNVTIDIAALALKSGNAVILRGGSAAESTNRVLVELLQEAVASVGLPADLVQTVDDHGRDGAKALMRARGYVDVLVPRGSAGLIESVVTESTVPVIETGAGVVHVFLDASADEQWAVDIVHNAKVQRPSTCNALETLLVHRDSADRLLPPVLSRLAEAGVTVHGDERVVALWPDAVPASREDWSAEYYSLDVAVAIVDDLDAAMAHIDRY